MGNAEILDLFSLSERLYSQLLERIQAELIRLQLFDINSVRALILLNIGEDTMTASDLLWRGCYVGSNVSYNLRKLTEAGYVVQMRSAGDKRVVMVRNSPRGIELFHILDAMNTRHVEALAADGLTPVHLLACRQTLRAVHRVWEQRQERASADTGSTPLAATG